MERLRDPAWLRHEYVDHERGLDEIGAEIGVAASTIWWWLRAHGIRTRPIRDATRRRMSASAKARTPISAEVRKRMAAGQQRRRARERQKSARELVELRALQRAARAQAARRIRKQLVHKRRLIGRQDPPIILRALLETARGQGARFEQAWGLAVAMATANEPEQGDAPGSWRSLLGKQEGVWRDAYMNDGPRAQLDRSLLDADAYERASAFVA
jgi:hypothetical protein